MNELWGGAVTSAEGSITMAHTKPAAQDSYVITSQPVADDLDAWTRITWEAVADDAWTTNPTYKALLPSEAAGHFGAPHNVIYRAFEWLAPGAKFKERWRMRATSNGSFYLIPGLATKTVEMYCPSNGHTATVSAEAAGITASLFGFKRMSGPDTQQAARAYIKLQDFAMEHREVGAIHTLVDFEIL
jgi:hypothetical protein